MSRSRQSSEEILYHGLVSSAKIIRRTHSAIQKELAAMETELTRPATLPARKMELLRCIVEIGAELSRQAESIAKLITAKPAPGSADGSPTLTTQEILAEIVSGKAKKSSGQR
jgi:hypothetical protein